MTKKEIEKQCGRVCPGAALSKCAFTHGEIIGFIDTSARNDGTRGIAFSLNGMTVRTDGFAGKIAYDDIRSVSIVESFENSFADELIISGSGVEIRITDYSLDKTELKKLIDGLCGKDIRESEKAVENKPEISEIAEASMTAEQEKPVEIAESNENAEDIRFENESSGASEESKDETDKNIKEHQNKIPEDARENSEDLAKNKVSEKAEESIPNKTFESSAAAVLSGLLDRREQSVIPKDNREELENSESDGGLPFNSDVFEVDIQHDISAVFQDIGVSELQQAKETQLGRELLSVIPEAVEESENAVSEDNKELESFSGENTSLPEIEEKQTFSFAIAEDDDFDEQAELEKISAMSHEQTISYLADAFAEINNTEPPTINDAPQVIEEARQVDEVKQQAVIEEKREDKEPEKPLEKLQSEDPMPQVVIEEVKQVDEVKQRAVIEEKREDKEPEKPLEKLPSEDLMPQVVIEEVKQVDEVRQQAVIEEKREDKETEKPLEKLPSEDPMPQVVIEEVKQVDEVKQRAEIEEKSEDKGPEKLPAEQPEKKVIEEVRERLTVEPTWGDIYIKASRSLRELCEQGRLSMDSIRKELGERLISTAETFAEITSDESKIPKVLMPRITELRSAANNFDEYFSYGEDVGTRAMFFMLFQMLSYAYRIVEDDEAKERLNDFYRRFGSVGIILSMLDMRV